ncbi:MAG: hypothetical protein ACRC11_15510 [Xenococcaceae cyanobacterium]
MLDFLQKAIDGLQKLTLRDTLELAAIATIAIPVYLVYWGTQNSEPLIELISGERIIGTVTDCLLTEYKQGKKVRYRLVLNLERKDDTDITIAAGSLTRWTDSDSGIICDRLVEIRNKIRN